MQVDPRFLDVDFRADPRYVAGDTAPSAARAFATGTNQLFGNQLGYEDKFGTIPESEWKSHIAAVDAAGGGLDLMVNWIYNQRNEGSCVGNASCQALEISQSIQFGKDKSAKLSAISLYKRIGSSPGSGAMVSDALDELTKRGALPLDTPENRAKYGNAVMPATGFYTQWPDNWEATAKGFRIHESLVIRSVEGLVSAILCNRPVVVGRAGHSICYTRFGYKDGGLVAKYANSWGEWGDNGFGYDSMGMIRSSAGWAFAICSSTVPGDVT